MVRYSKNCDESDQIITMINSSIIINNKCETISRSCSDVKAYKTAMVIKQANRKHIKFPA